MLPNSDVSSGNTSTLGTGEAYCDGAVDIDGAGAGCVRLYGRQGEEDKRRSVVGGKAEDESGVGRRRAFPGLGEP